MSAHSPGPWRIVVPHGAMIDHQSPIEDAQGKGILEIDPDWDAVDDCVKIPNEADARLIAEAPALLALARYAAQRGEGDAEMAREILARIDRPWRS